VYIESLPYKEVYADYRQGTFESYAKVFNSYTGWDKTKSRACLCDAQYGDIDCSKRMCPYGTDVMDVRNNQDAAAKYQVQSILFETNYGTAFGSQSFALTFKSKLNETFTTIPIAFEPYSYDLHDFVLNVQNALEGLPNRVIDKVEVHASQTFDTVFTLNVSFVGDSVQGPQNLLTVESYLCGDGCTPRITGANWMPKTQNITELQLSDFNSFECGRRGKCDYSTGICNCFAGYTGINCNTITALV